MKKLIIALAVLALVSSVAWAGVETKPLERVTQELRPTRNVTYFLDTMESGPGDWTTVDWTAVPQPIYWHVTTHLAHPSGVYSYFCGIEPPTGWPLELNNDGGYGNSWDQRLDMPAVNWAGAGYPLLSYSYRHDMELDFDTCMLQAHQGGVFVDVMTPDKVHTGVSGGGEAPVWVDMVGVGHYLVPFDNPMVARLQMTSDGGWSDQDGMYDSQCGAIHVDNLIVWDYYGMGGPYWTDDVEDGVGDCTFSVAPVTGMGDYWHIIDRPCRATSSSHVWWCGDDADTSVVPPGLENGLISPDVDVSGAITCTMYFTFTIEFPVGGGDYGWQEFLYVDGMQYPMGYYWGCQCADYGYTACTHFWNGNDDWTDYLPATTMNYEWRIISDPVIGIVGGCGGAGYTLDDLWFFGQDVTSVEESSWGNIKAMYR